MMAAMLELVHCHGARCGSSEGACSETSEAEPPSPASHARSACINNEFWHLLREQTAGIESFHSVSQKDANPFEAPYHPESACSAHHG
jgi:hypothetical protein